MIENIQSKMVLVFFYSCVLIVTSGCRQSEWTLNQGTVTIGDQIITVEIADEPAELGQGLGGRQNLAEDKGMFFIFQNYSRHSFWMKGMNFSLDIIWLKDDKIVDIMENVPVVEEGQVFPIYKPKTEVNYVIEVNAGYVKNHEIKIGDKVVVDRF